MPYFLTKTKLSLPKMVDDEIEIVYEDRQAHLVRLKGIGLSQKNNLIYYFYEVTFSVFMNGKAPYRYVGYFKNGDFVSA